MVVPFPRAEKYFMVIGVWESLRGRRVLLNTLSKDSLMFPHLTQGQGGGRVRDLIKVSFPQNS